MHSYSFHELSNFIGPVLKKRKAYLRSYIKELLTETFL